MLSRAGLGAIVCTLLAGGAVLWFLAMLDGRISARDDATIREAKVVLAASRPFHEQIAQLQASRDSALDQARAAQESAVVEESTIKRLSADTSIIGLRIAFPPLDSLLRSYERSQRAYQRALFLMYRVHRADSTMIIRQAHRIAALEHSLSATVQVADCRMLGLSFLPSCPSRTTSFLVGGGVMFLAMLAVR